MKKIVIHFCFLLMIFVCSFFAGRNFRFRDYLLLKYGNTRIIYKKSLFPGCMETETFIKLFIEIHKSDEVYLRHIKPDLLQLLDERISYNKERARNRAIHAKEQYANVIWKTLDRMENFK